MLLLAVVGTLASSPLDEPWDGEELVGEEWFFISHTSSTTESVTEHSRPELYLSDASSDSAPDGDEVRETTDDIPLAHQPVHDERGLRGVRPGIDDRIDDFIREYGLYYFVVLLVALLANFAYSNSPGRS